MIHGVCINVYVCIVTFDGVSREGLSGTLEKSEGLVKEEVASAKALESGLVLEGPV